jgi:autotransporter translocation and assembly factor TamB
MARANRKSALAAEQNDVAIVAGKRINKDLHVRYSHNALSAIGALIIRYHLTDRWRLDATNDASSSMDLLYEFSR